MLEEKLIDIVKTAVRDVLNEKGVSTKESPVYKDGDIIKGVLNLSIYMSVSYSTAYKLVARGEIKGFKVGSSHRFLKSDIDEYMRVARG